MQTCLQGCWCLMPLDCFVPNSLLVIRRPTRRQNQGGEDSSLNGDPPPSQDHHWKGGHISGLKALYGPCWWEGWGSPQAQWSRCQGKFMCRIRLEAAEMWGPVDSFLGVRTDSIYFFQQESWDFPGDAVVENPPANAGDTGSSPGPGGSHMPQSN